MAKILVVDDMANWRDLLSDLFSEKGHEVKSASTSSVAIDLAKSWQPDAITVDGSIEQKGDGLLLAAELRQLTQAPIAMVSAGNLTFEGKGVDKRGFPESFSILMEQLGLSKS